MIKCVAIYPHHLDDTYKDKVSETVSLAFKYGFNEIFTTLHLPEYSLDEQFSCFEIIAKQAKKYNLDLMVDIGGNFIEQLLNDEDKLNKIKKLKLDFIRLDYGYNLEQVNRLYNSLNVRGFVINASMYTKKQIDETISAFKNIDSNIEIRALHNFYVRKESGLDDLFAAKQDSYFEEYNIPIYYCIPTHSNPRGPIFEGLCTIEKHRYLPLKDIFIDLVVKHDLKAFLMADEWLSIEEFKEVETILNKLENNDNKILVEFFESASKKEKDIVLGKHMFRYDSPLSNIRSRSSRQMAEFASLIDPNNTIERKTGYITVDNSLYKRYSGEMQVTLKDMDKDERVNVVAKLVSDDDIYKLLHFKNNKEFIFIEK